MSRPLSVCFLAGEFPPATGGVGDYTELLAEQLHQDGVEVSVVARGAAGPAGAGSAEVGGGAAAGGVPVHWIAGWGLPGIEHLSRFAKERRVDVLHLEYQAGAFASDWALHLAPWLLRRRGVAARFVTTFHDLRVPSLLPKAGPLRSLALESLIRASDGVVFTHPADLVRSGRSRSVAWIPIGANVTASVPPDQAAGRTHWGISADELVLAFFGFVNRSKGLPNLLEAAAILRAEGVPVRLLLVGDQTGVSDASNFASASEALAAVDRLGLEHDVIWTGPLNRGDVSLALGAANLAVLPYEDGASLRRGSLLACLAHGLPVVTTRAESVPPLAASSTVVPFDAPDSFALDEVVVASAARGPDLATAIRTLVRDPARMAGLSRAGPAFVARLSWPRISEAHRTFYGRVLAGPAKP